MGHAQRLHRERQEPGEQAEVPARAPAPLPPNLLAAGNHAVTQLLSRDATATKPAPAKVETGDEPVASDATAIEAALAAASETGEKSHNKWTEEESGKKRDELVRRIKRLRDAVDGLADTDPKKAEFHQRITGIAPFYTQASNMKLLGNAPLTTCNCTTTAMALESLGRTATSYKGSMAKLNAIAAEFKDIVATANDNPSGRVMSLRLPDFVQLVAVAVKLGGQAATPENIEAAKTSAFGWIDQGSDPVRTLLGMFGVKTRLLKPAEPTADALNTIGKKHTGAKDVIPAIDARQRAEKAGKSTDDDVKAGGRAVKGLAGEEKEVQLAGYKKWVMDTLGPELDTGKPVIVGQWMHWTRLQALTNDYVIVDDPGGDPRGNRKTAWEEARALGMFWIIVVADG